MDPILILGAHPPTVNTTARREKTTASAVQLVTRATARRWAELITRVTARQWAEPLGERRVPETDGILRVITSRGSGGVDTIDVRLVGMVPQTEVKVHGDRASTVVSGQGVRTTIKVLRTTIKVLGEARVVR